jgi:hypothetical protein
VVVERPGVHLHVRGAIARVVAHLLVDHLCQTLTRGLVAHVVSWIPGPREVRLRSERLCGRGPKPAGTSSRWWRWRTASKWGTNSDRTRLRHVDDQRRFRGCSCCAGCCTDCTHRGSDEPSKERTWDASYCTSFRPICSRCSCSKEPGRCSREHATGGLSGGAGSSTTHSAAEATCYRLSHRPPHRWRRRRRRLVRPKVDLPAWRCRRRRRLVGPKVELRWGCRRRHAVVVQVLSPGIGPEVELHARGLWWRVYERVVHVDVWGGILLHVLRRMRLSWATPWSGVVGLSEPLLFRTGRVDAIRT